MRRCAKNVAENRLAASPKGKQFLLHYEAETAHFLSLVQNICIFSGRDLRVAKGMERKKVGRSVEGGKGSEEEARFPYSEFLKSASVTQWVRANKE